MAYLFRVNKLSPAVLFVVVFSFFVQPVREVSCALFFRGESVPSEAKDDIMWYGFVCCSLVVHMAIQKNRRKGRQRREGREGGRGSNYFLSVTQPSTHNTLAVRVLSSEHTGTRTVLREENRQACDSRLGSEAMTDTHSLQAPSSQPQQPQYHGTHTHRHTDFICEREHTARRTVPAESTSVLSS